MSRFLTTRMLGRLILALSLALGAAGCGSNAEAVGVVEVEQVDPGDLPVSILGLDVELEDMSERLGSVRQGAYVEAAGLFSLREDDVLQATLQVTRFIDDAEIDDPEFRAVIVAQIGSTTVRPFRMGEHEVYLSTTQRQSIAAWFKDKTLFILSTGDGYPSPRTLLRAALEIDA